MKCRLLFYYYCIKILILYKNVLGNSYSSSKGSIGSIDSHRHPLILATTTGTTRIGSHGKTNLLPTSTTKIQPFIEQSQQQQQQQQQQQRHSRRRKGRRRRKYIIIDTSSRIPFVITSLSTSSIATNHYKQQQQQHQPIRKMIHQLRGGNSSVGDSSNDGGNSISNHHNSTTLTSFSSSSNHTNTNNSNITSTITNTDSDKNHNTTIIVNHQLVYNSDDNDDNDNNDNVDQQENSSLLQSNETIQHGSNHPSSLSLLLIFNLQLYQQTLNEYKQIGIQYYKQQFYTKAILQFHTTIHMILYYPILHIKHSIISSSSSTNTTNTTNTTIPISLSDRDESIITICLQDILSNNTISTTTNHNSSSSTTIMKVDDTIDTSSSSVSFSVSSMKDIVTQLVQDYSTILLHISLCYIQYCSNEIEFITSIQEEEEEEEDDNNVEVEMENNNDADDDHIRDKHTKQPQKIRFCIDYLNQAINMTTNLIHIFDTCVTSSSSSSSNDDEDSININDNNILNNDMIKTKIIQQQLPVYIPISITTEIRAKAHYRRAKAISMKMKLYSLVQKHSQLYNSTNMNHDMITTMTSTMDTNTTTENSSTDTNETSNVLDLDIEIEQQHQEQQILNDVRIAALLGNKKAVSWYGQLLRQQSNTKNINYHEMTSDQKPSSINEIIGTSEYDAQQQSSLSTTTMSSTTDPTNLLSSFMMGSNNNNNNNNNAADSSTSNLMSQLLMSSIMPTGNKNSNGNDSNKNPIQSFVESFIQRITNDSTMQYTICQFLQNISLQQIQQYIQLFGLSNIISSTHIETYIKPLIRLCHTITIQRLQLIINISKCINYIRQIIQSCCRIINKYRTIIIFYILHIWISSSIHRPFPISKRLQRLQKITPQIMTP